MFHGKGRYITNEKTYYEGDFSMGEPNGLGTEVWIGIETFFGTFWKGKWEGKGVLLKENGDKWDGFWIDGLWNGSFKVIFVNGDIFEGQMKEDRIYGMG